MIYLSQYEQRGYITNREAEHQAGRRLLAYALLQEYQIQDEVIQEAGKKPRWKSHPNIQFNISHSGGLAACVLARNVVGIDVEYIRPFHIHLMRRICSTDEIAYITGEESDREKMVNDVKCQERFFRIWTLKESFVKAIGEGLAFPLKDITFCITEYHNGEIAIKGSIPNWRFYQFRFQGKYMISVCESAKDCTEKEDKI